MKGNPLTPSSIRVGLLVASVRSSRLADTIASWAASTWQSQSRFETVLVDLADYDLPPSMERTEDVERFTKQLTGLDAVVVITPEYNHSYPGYLKIALDTISGELSGKPVGFISYGGISAGLRSVEHLRPVFSELGAVTTRAAVGLTMPWNLVREGRLEVAPASFKAMDVLARDLQWWVDATRGAHDDQGAA